MQEPDKLRVGLDMMIMMIAVLAVSIIVESMVMLMATAVVMLLMQTCCLTPRRFSLRAHVPAKHGRLARPRILWLLAARAANAAPADAARGAHSDVVEAHKACTHRTTYIFACASLRLAR